MNTKIGVAAAAVLLALTLTGCGNNTPTPVETKTPTPVEVVTPTPTPTETGVTVLPEDEIVQEDTVNRDADGVFVLPDGSTMECDPSAKVVYLVNNEWVCDSNSEF